MLKEFEDFKRRVAVPPVIGEKDDYVIKFASTEGERNDAYQLRYRVFTEEQGRMLSSRGKGVDKDEFDDYCCHLQVREKSSGNLMGTYRIHNGGVARKSGLGFYSEREFKIAGLREMAGDAIEVGRTCVAPQGRNGTVMALLWSGISVMMHRSGQRYLFGCASLEDTSPETGWGLYRYFQKKGCLSDSLKAEPLDSFRMPRVDLPNAELFSADPERVRQALPPLFKGYLRMGAKICGEPAFDAEFGSIDFLIVLDVEKLPERYVRHFKVETGGDAK